MIIPVRCFTCGKVIGNKWETYLALLQADFSEGWVWWEKYLRAWHFFYPFSFFHHHLCVCVCGWIVILHFFCQREIKRCLNTNTTYMIYWERENEYIYKTLLYRIGMFKRYILRLGWKSKSFFQNFNFNRYIFVSGGTLTFVGNICLKLEYIHNALSLVYIPI